MAAKQTYKAYRARLYPTPEQEAYFRRMFGCCRLVYNHFLSVRIATYEERKHDPEVRVPTRFDMCRMLTDFKRERTDAKGHAFLRDVDSTALVYEISHLDDAFGQFYRRVRSGQRNVGFPRFKKRGDKDSATVAFRRAEDMRPRRIRFAKVGWVPACAWRELEGAPISCTVSVDAAGRWWASVLCKDVPVCAPPPSDAVAVVDMNALSGGAADPALEKRLRRERRRLSRRQGPGPHRRASARWLAQRERVGRLVAQEHDRMVTQTHQLTARLVRDNGTIVVESDDQLQRCPEASELVRQLRYKCDWANRELVERETPA